MLRRSVTAIALSSSNIHGEHYFMSLYTGKRLNSYIWNETSTSNEVISRVKALAEDEKTSLIADGYTIFEWSSEYL